MLQARVFSPLIGLVVVAAFGLAADEPKLTGSFRAEFRAGQGGTIITGGHGHAWKETTEAAQRRSGYGWKNQGRRDDHTLERPDG